MSPETIFQSMLGTDQVVPWSSLNDAQLEPADGRCVVFPLTVVQLSAVVRTCY